MRRLRGVPGQRMGRRRRDNGISMRGWPRGDTTENWARHEAAERNHRATHGAVERRQPEFWKGGHDVRWLRGVIWQLMGRPKGDNGDLEKVGTT